MKTIKFLLIVLLFFSFNLLLHSQWQFQNPKGSYADISAFSFINSQTGWTGSSQEDFISQTKDGGKTWSVINDELQSRIMVLSFINGQTGYVSTSDQIVYKTTNGGINFFEFYVSTSNINAMYIYNNNYIWLGNSLGNITYTTNGGNTWDSTPVSSGYINKIKFLDINNGYCFTSLNEVYKTTNKGQTWNLLYTSPVQIYDMFFKNINHGWLACSQKILITQNGGLNWDETVTTANPGYIAFANNYDGWYIGDNNKIFRSEDGGFTFTEQTLPYININNTLYGIIPINSNLAYTFGSEGNIFKTKDAGNQWTNITNITTADLTSVYFNNHNTGWCVGLTGTILKTTNKGTDWKIKNSGTTTNLYCVRSVNSSIVYACGLNGLLLKSVNGGNTWTSYNFPTSKDLFTIFFINNNTGWIGGDSVLYKTTNQGNTWFEQQSNVLSRGIFFLNENTGWIASGNGLYKTIDGGNTWFKKSNGNLRSVYFINNTGYASGGSYTLKKSIDYGETWFSNIDSIAKSPPATYTGVWMNDTDNAWFSVAHTFGGRINKINDTTSTSFYVHRLSFYSICGIKNGSIWGCGENGLIVSRKLSDIILDEENNNLTIPANYSLKQNYPNPFNPTTKIDFSVPKQGYVSIKVFDLLGREVKTLVNEVKQVGNYSIDFNATSLSSGVYFYRMQSENFVQTKSMVIIK